MSFGFFVPLLLPFLASQAPDSPAELRSLTVSVTDGKGRAVEGLAREDVVVLENGVPRVVERLERDTRPLTALVLVDSSQAIEAHYRLNVVGAVVAFLRRLPEGSSFAVWTTGDRPTKRVDYTADLRQAEGALKLVVPQGGTTLLDALVEASRELKKREGERTVVVVVSALGPEFSSRDRLQVVEEAKGNAGTFAAVLVEEGAVSFDERTRFDYVLSELTGRSGGLYERPLSAMGVEAALQKIAGDLRGQYRLRYATLPGLKERKIQVSVARPEVKVRVGLPTP